MTDEALLALVHEELKSARHAAAKRRHADEMYSILVSVHIGRLCPGDILEQSSQLIKKVMNDE